MNVSTALGRMRLIGFLEGASFLVLLGIAMPLKYLAGDPSWVRIVGLVHGFLFLAYLWAIFQAYFENPWPRKLPALLVVASLLPFGPFIADRKCLRGLEADRR
jgi:integral membrane protein